MKEVLLYMLIYSIFAGLFAQQSIKEISLENPNSMSDSTDFHNKFQEAFTEVLAAVDNDFENVDYDTTVVKLDNTIYNKLMLDFPQAEYTIYNKSPIPEQENKYQHTLKIFYDAKKNENDIFLDNEIYNELYTDVLNEFDAIHKVELGGKWNMTVNRSGFKMLLDEDPSLKIFVKPSGKTGFEIEFDLIEE